MIALVTESRYVVPSNDPNDWYSINLHREDELLGAQLRALGYDFERVDWANPAIEWSSYEAVVIRTTWDYFYRIEEFMAWLGARERDSVLINPPSLLRWNLDKHYLQDLQRSGVAVVPTFYLEQGCPYDWNAIEQWLQGRVGILKPCVSAGAKDTFRIEASDRQTWTNHLDRLLATDAMMIQPFQERIVSEGEFTMMVMGGTFTHAVRKVAKAGDFRVQDDHGGKVHPHQATAEEIAFAERAVASCPWLPIYARVDAVRNVEGELQIMELEAVEPELWLRFHPPAARPFAEGIDSFLKARADVS